MGGGLCRGRAEPVRPKKPVLILKEILAWADAHYRRTGKWPGQSSGYIPEAPGNTWSAVDVALRRGYRGLPGKSSLVSLLHEHRGVTRPTPKPFW
jgi:hypothetical protein